MSAITILDDDDIEFQADLARAIAASLEQDFPGPLVQAPRPEVSGWNALVAVGQAATSNWGPFPEGKVNVGRDSPALISADDDDDDEDFQRQVAAAKEASIQSAAEERRRRQIAVSSGSLARSKHLAAIEFGSAPPISVSPASRPSPAPLHQLQLYQPHQHHQNLLTDKGSVCCSGGLVLKPLTAGRGVASHGPHIPASKSPFGALASEQWQDARQDAAAQSGSHVSADSCAKAAEAIDDDGSLEFDDHTGTDGTNPIIDRALSATLPGPTPACSPCSSGGDNDMLGGSGYLHRSTLRPIEPNMPQFQLQHHSETLSDSDARGDRAALAGCVVTSGLPRLASSPAKHARTPSIAGTTDWVQPQVKRSRQVSNSDGGVTLVSVLPAEAPCPTGNPATGWGSIRLIETSGGARPPSAASPQVHSPPERPPSAASCSTALTGMAAAIDGEWVASAVAPDVSVLLNTGDVAPAALQPLSVLGPAGADLQHSGRAADRSAASLAVCRHQFAGDAAAAVPTAEAPHGSAPLGRPRVGSAGSASVPPQRPRPPHLPSQQQQQQMKFSVPYPLAPSLDDQLVLSALTHTRDHLQDFPQQQSGGSERRKQWKYGDAWSYDEQQLHEQRLGVRMVDVGMDNSGGVSPSSLPPLDLSKPGQQRLTALTDVAPLLRTSRDMESVLQAPDTRRLQRGQGRDCAATATAPDCSPMLPRRSPANHTSTSLSWGGCQDNLEAAAAPLPVPPEVADATEAAGEAASAFNGYSGADRRMLLHQRVWWWLGPGQVQTGRICSIDYQSEPLLYSVRLDDEYVAVAGSRRSANIPALPSIIIATADCLFPYLTHGDKLMCRLPPSVCDVVIGGGGDDGGGAAKPAGENQKVRLLEEWPGYVGGLAEAAGMGAPQKREPASGVAAGPCAWMWGTLQHCIFDGRAPMVHVLLGPYGVPYSVPYEFVVPVSDVAEGSGCASSSDLAAEFEKEPILYGPLPYGKSTNCMEIVPVSPVA